MRRIATDRPATEAVAVRVIILLTVSFWLARLAGAHGARRGAAAGAVRSSYGSMSKAGANGVFLTRGVGGAGWARPAIAAAGDTRILPRFRGFVKDPFGPGPSGRSAGSFRGATVARRQRRRGARRRVVHAGLGTIGAWIRRHRATPRSWRSRPR